MKLYHFVNEEFGLKDLTEKRLKIATIMELNDPFEFLGYELSDPQLRKAMNKTKLVLSKTRGMICFSKNWNNPVQWAHYANKHKGLCLGFEIPEADVEKVNYVGERLRFSGSPNEALVMRLLTTKFAHWEYEEEYRSFYYLKEHESGLYFANFSENLKLEQVIIGANSKITPSQIKKLVGKKIEVFKSRAAFRTFSIVKNLSTTRKA